MLGMDSFNNFFFSMIAQIMVKLGLTICYEIKPIYTHQLNIKNILKASREFWSIVEIDKVK